MLHLFGLGLLWTITLPSAFLVTVKEVLHLSLRLVAAVKMVLQQAGM
jgi:hypothetical protein